MDLLERDKPECKGLLKSRPTRTELPKEGENIYEIYADFESAEVNKSLLELAAFPCQWPFLY